MKESANKKRGRVNSRRGQGRMKSIRKDAEKPGQLYNIQIGKNRQVSNKVGQGAYVKMGGK